MKIIKRNQLIILVISLMLITAGYLNFTTDNNTVPTSEIIAELGDATLVNSNVIEDENNSENDEENNEILENDVEDAQETSTTVGEDQYFINSKLERENMYSQMLETYQQIYNNSQTSSDAKTSALEEIAKINNIKNEIMIAENLISAKGFKDLVIFVSENSVSIIIGEEDLQTEQIAQIQNIVSRELNVGLEKIHISTK